VWSLVQINHANGRVTLIGDLSSEVLGDYYGGGIYGGTSIINANTVLHQFRKSNTGSTTLGMIDLATGKMRSMTSFNTGVNNAISLNSVVYLPPSS